MARVILAKPREVEEHAADFRSGALAHAARSASASSGGHVSGAKSSSYGARPVSKWRRHKPIAKQSAS